MLSEERLGGGGGDTEGGAVELERVIFNPRPGYALQ